MEREARVLQDRINIAALERCVGDAQERIRSGENEKLKGRRDPGPLSERLIAVQVMCIEDRAHVANAMARDGGDLRFGTADQCQAGDGGTAQIAERHLFDLGPLAGLAP
jgi:hypothetical protein